MFNLEKFLPYRFSLLSQTISRLIASEYKDRFDLSMTDWRCLVIIHQHQPITAKQIGEKTRLEKMAISRSITRLIAKKLINKTSAANDGRAFLLSTNKKGDKIYNEILPLALSYENELLSALSKTELDKLYAMLNKLQDKAEKLNELK